MKILARIGSVLSLLLMLLGVFSGAFWIAAKVGLVQPLIVVSGSMEPKISTGDLLIATSQPVSELKVGEVATLMSAKKEKYVTHRVTAVKVNGTAATVTMQGDANSVQDSEDYHVESRYLAPKLTIPGAGYALQGLTKTPTFIALGVAVIALLGLTLLPKPSDEEESSEANHE